MSVEFDSLPRQHRHALLSLRFFGGSFNPIDSWVASVEAPELYDLRDLGLVRKRRLSWQLTLAGWDCIGDRRLVA